MTDIEEVMKEQGLKLSLQDGSYMKLLVKKLERLGLEKNSEYAAPKDLLASLKIIRDMTGLSIPKCIQVLVAKHMAAIRLMFEKDTSEDPEGDMDMLEERALDIMRYMQLLTYYKAMEMTNE